MGSITSFNDDSKIFDAFRREDLHILLSMGSLNTGNLLTMCMYWLQAPSRVFGILQGSNLQMFAFNVHFHIVFCNAFREMSNKSKMNFKYIRFPVDSCFQY